MPRRAARGPATTPCPRCGRALPARGERGTCPGCGLAVRFVDVPERPCAGCGQPVALLPGREALRCAACGRWQAAEEGRPVEGVAACPRCGRDVPVPLDADRGLCGRCGTALRLEGP